jgi:hypothetical protein
MRARLLGARLGGLSALDEAGGATLAADLSMGARGVAFKRGERVCWRVRLGDAKRAGLQKARDLRQSVDWQEIADAPPRTRRRRRRDAPGGSDRSNR